LAGETCLQSLEQQGGTDAFVCQLDGTLIFFSPSQAQLRLSLSSARDGY
jgi:hypothetical protein